MCRICVSLGLVRSIPESRFLVLFLACMFSLNPIFELLLGRGNTKLIRTSICMCHHAIYADTAIDSNRTKHM